MKPVEWKVDEETRVRISDDEIEIRQDADDDMDTIILSPTGASAEGMIRALLLAVEAIGWDVPDLSREGYVSDE